MVPFRSVLGLAAVLGGSLLLAAAPANAQPAPTSNTSPYTTAGPVAAGPLSGYTGKFPTPLPVVSANTFRTGVGSYSYFPSTGVGTYYYSPTVFEAYSPVIETRSGIFMTTINYPGLYGAYFASVPAVAYNTRPSASNFYTVGETTILPPRTVTITPTLRAVPEPPPTEETTARLNVLLPSEATLYIQGVRMDRTGSFREFISPPLVPGEVHTYNLHATWKENGRDVARDELVRVRPGERTDVDLNRGTPREVQEPSTLRTRPLP
jgi:uncharacterized protein (TIGR03000 family)